MEEWDSLDPINLHNPTYSTIRSHSETLCILSELNNLTACVIWCVFILQRESDVSYALHRRMCPVLVRGRFVVHTYKSVQGLRSTKIYHWINANQLKEIKSLYQLGGRSLI